MFFLVDTMQVVNILIYILAGLLGLCILIYLIAFLIIKIVHNKMFNFHDTDPNNPCYLSFKDYENNLEREEFSIKINEKETVGGYYYTRKNLKEYKGFILLSPGYGGTHIQYLLDINYLCDKGYKVMAYDQIGTGLSSGKSMVDLAHGGDVCYQLVTYIKENNLNEGLKFILYGHSWGGYSVIKGCTEDVDLIISRSGFDCPIACMLAMFQKFGVMGKILSPFLYMYYKLFHKKNSFEFASKHYLSLNKRPKLLIVYAFDDQMLPRQVSLAEEFNELLTKDETLKNDAGVFITPSGYHNTVLDPNAFDKFKTNLEEYKSVENDEEKKKEFIENLNLVQTYKLNKEHIDVINMFLDRI